MKKILLYLLFFVLTIIAVAEDTLPKHPKDQRTYRKFVLANGLKVLLVSDPDVNVSAASMDVAVGSLADPPQRQGLAHFVEHMLFLATKKYPKLNSYGEYLKSRGGYSNAFTAPDRTNYHFQVSHDGLPEALDRFAQFFIAPLLTQKYAAREVRAVHSEHQKNMLVDVWRLQQIRRSLLKPGHPANAFHTGNMETLGDTSREELKAFLEDYYGPQRMALCIIGKDSLDKLENLARTTFAAIPQKPIKPFIVDEHILDRKDCLRLVTIEPVKDIRELRLYFPVPSQHNKMLSKTSRLIGMTMGDEGKGSLLSLLKEKGLATSLSAGVGNETRFYSSCSVTVGLTPKGLQEYRQVITLCLSYIAMLKKNELPQHIWEEMKTMARLGKLYSPQGEGTEEAIHLAANANYYGLEMAENIDYIFTKPDKENYAQILQALSPDNMLVFLVAKGVPTDKVDKWYGTKYAIQEEKSDFYQSLTTVTAHPQLHLPVPNQFIPQEVDLLPEQPVLIVNDNRITLWYSQDTEFLRPKVALYLHILSPATYTNARSAALTTLYTALMREQLNEFSYPALMAGLNYNLSSTKKGISLSVNGYSESALKLLQVVGQKLRNLSVSDKTFNSVKERIVRGWKNFPLSPAYLVVREFSREINLRKYFPPGQLLAAIHKIELEDVKQFVRILYARNHIEGLAHGNLPYNQVVQAVDALYAHLQTRSCDRQQIHQDEVLWLEHGDDLTYKQTLPGNNSCLRMEYQVGNADLPNQAATWILDRAIRNAFYTEMRTKQMLGYIVFSGSYARENVQNMLFIIQSGTHSAPELAKRADAFLVQVPEMFAQISSQNFHAIRNSLIEDRKKKSKSIAAKAAFFYQLAFEEKADFNLLTREIKALENITKEQVIALATKVFSKESCRRLTILANAKQHADDIPGTIVDIKEFHQQRVFDQ